MTKWDDVSEGIDRFVLWTKESVVLSAAAKVALRSIPVVGPILADIYDEAGERPPDAAIVLETLARIEALGANGLQQSVAVLEAARSAEEDAQAALTVANERLGDLQEGLRRIQAEMVRMEDSLGHLEAEVTDLAWGAAEFDTSSVADQAALLVMLKSSLSRSSEVFDEQLRIADTIIGAAKKSVPPELEGKDDVLWWLSRNDGIDAADRIAFIELRAVTDRMKDINLRVRWLIRRYGSTLPGNIPVSELDLHLSTWLAKYEYLRVRSDKHMALVFVGVAPTNVGFPRGVDAAVEHALQESMRKAKLGHILE